jgi:hypothetical protein
MTGAPDRDKVRGKLTRADRAPERTAGSTGQATSADETAAFSTNLSANATIHPAISHRQASVDRRSRGPRATRVDGGRHRSLEEVPLVAMRVLRVTGAVA